MPSRRGLTRAEILDTALALADDDGFAAVGMRAVAQRLGVTPMALYRHVGDKEALLDGLVERLLTEVDVPGPEQAPVDRLLASAASLRAVARRHPEAFGLLLARRAATPGALDARDAVLAALVEAGVARDDVGRLERILSTFVIGFAASEASGRFADVERADADFAYAVRLLTTALAATTTPPPAGS